MLVHSEAARTQASIMKKYHSPTLSENQCGSTQVRTIEAALPLVWSIIKQFNNPQAYKAFIKSCTILAGNGTGVGSVRELEIVSGLAGKTITEKLDDLDDDSCLMVVTRIGGDDRLDNYKSTTTLHESEEEDEGGLKKTILIESYVVDIPSGSCPEDTCYFADTVIGFNHRSLAKLSQDIHACITALASHTYSYFSSSSRR
ncbi:abscisic acid receptor PYL11-like [Euphorbia lathyris]|uniref:abscisic acid receptor PYL11-like n=1 Tax=Euphorbia lathyris TaxID=212925 RepID=UPI00331411CC